jgi:hypothetical protein
MGVMAVNEIRPRWDEYEELRVSLTEQEIGCWAATAEFARAQSSSTVVATVALSAMGIACYCVDDAWATFGIVIAMALFGGFATRYAKKEDRENEPGNEPGSPKEAGTDQRKDGRELIPSRSPLAGNL